MAYWFDAGQPVFYCAEYNTIGIGWLAAPYGEGTILLGYLDETYEQQLIRRCEELLSGSNEEEFYV